MDCSARESTPEKRRRKNAPAINDNAVGAANRRAGNK
jgi:hypothetical protein